MGAIALPTGAAVSGLDTHGFAGSSATGQCRFQNRPVRLSSHSVVQEALFSSRLAVNGSAHVAGKKALGSGRGRRQRFGSGSKRRVSPRCAASGEIDKDDSDSEGRNGEGFREEAVGASGSGRLPRESKPQVRLLTFCALVIFPRWSVDRSRKSGQLEINTVKGGNLNCQWRSRVL